MLTTTISKKTDTHFAVKVDKILEFIKFADVNYFRIDGKMITIDANGNKYSSRGSFKKLEKIIPDYFIRVHSGFIVNVRTIKSINVAESLINMDDVIIPVSRSRKKQLLEICNVI